MFCNKCGAQINDDAKFCPKCGGVNEPINSSAASAAAEPIEFNKIFFDPKERQIAVLGGSFLRNILSAGGVSSGSCVLSDKRLYFKGVCFTKENGRFVRTDEESTVGVKDITASGFTKYSQLNFLIFGIILMIIAIFLLSRFGPVIGGIAVGIALIPFLAYYLSKVKLFYVAFSGGKIAFRASDYSQKEMQEFQKALRLTIDAYGKKSL